MSLTIAANTATAARPDIATLAKVEQRVLWLSTSMIHHANRVRSNPSGLKVGGHQASSASIATIMTSLWFDQLRPEDRVSVKPHASPVLHGINYLLGELGEEHMGSLREFGGIQSYPSRAKDPDTVDYSTGSVGIGATAPIWGAIARRYSASIAGTSYRGRQYSLVGDAELDEGAVWEALLDSHVPDLGEVVWIVDLNRQSLDRVVPNLAARKLERMFDAAGWQVIAVPFGRRLEEYFTRPGGAELRERILSMPNAEYQRLLRCDASELRRRLPGECTSADAIRTLLDDSGDDDLVSTFRNLGGHDLAALRQAFSQIDDTRPTVIIAYTIKGNGLPTAGHPQNHSSLLTIEQYDAFAVEVGMDASAPWRRFELGTAEEQLCAATSARLSRDPITPSAPLDVPVDFGRTPNGSGTTQAALGRVLLDLTRSAPAVARRVVTASPDVSSSTNLAGWLNKVGVWSTQDQHNWFEDDPETMMHWRERPSGQHIELGIAEVNLVSLLGELGATWSRWGQPLYPIGVLYDPFVERALEPWTYGMYAGGQSILVGTPSGVSLSSEGGAHQSIKTPSIGIEQPECLSYEPAFIQEVEWMLLSVIGQIGRPGGRSSYLRLSTKTVDQGLAAMPSDPAARERRRRQVIAGGYRLRTATSAAATIVAMGAMVPDALRAADRLVALGRDIDVVCVTSAGLLFQAMQSRNGQDNEDSWILDQILPADRANPMVTVLDGHPHALAFLAGVHGVPSRHLGVSSFGQAGSPEDVYRHHGIDTDSIVRAVLDLTD